MSETRKGANNPNWRGGNWKKKNSFLDKIRRSQRYLDWKHAVLKRDVKSYPKVAKNIQVHHIKSFESIVRENNINTIKQAMACKALWDVNNGIALLKSEHMIITWMNRTRKHSNGFIMFVRAWIALHEDDAEDLQ